MGAARRVERFPRFSRVPAAILGLTAAVFLFGCAAPPAPSPSPSPQRRVSRPTPPRKPSAERPRPYKVLGRWYQPLASADGFRQRGLASWYGEPFHGRRTSNGEIYDMHQISAAHKILPLGTVVRVRNLDNGRTLDVRINDRGPFVRGRVIDLSYAAAKRLGVDVPGTAPVEVVAVGVTPPRPGAPLPQVATLEPGPFTIQVGAFGERTNAERLAASLKRLYNAADVRELYCPDRRQTFHRVLVGRIPTLEKAETYEVMLRRRGFPDAFTIAAD
ncbi:MAG: septal ring lytic transglycosylase RlpA family protein [Desulfococcaceae bacterium]